jgi:hypothetical protein
MTQYPPRAQSGTATVEFAIAFPIVMLSIMVVVEFSRLMLAYELCAEVSRRAARMASACNLDPGQTDAIAVRLQPLMDASGVLSVQGTAWLKLDYLPAGCTADTCRFVEARLEGLEPEISIPGLTNSVSFPAFATRIPREAMANSLAGDVNEAC